MIFLIFCIHMKLCSTSMCKSANSRELWIFRLMHVNLKEFTWNSTWMLSQFTWMRILFTWIAYQFTWNWSIKINEMLVLDPLRNTATFYIQVSCRHSNHTQVFEIKNVAVLRKAVKRAIVCNSHDIPTIKRPCTWWNSCNSRELHFWTISTLDTPEKEFYWTLGGV